MADISSIFDTGKALNAVGVPVALPNEYTSPASLSNVLANLHGAAKRGSNGVSSLLQGLGLR